VEALVVATSNRDLAALVESGAFRRDLYHRLCRFAIHVPPLRDRAGDMPELAGFFVGAAAAKCGVPPPDITAEALRKLASWRFPGNVRELENVIYSAVLTDRDCTLGPEDITLPQAADGPGAERDRILAALREADGNKSAAAQRLGVSRRTLYRRLDELGLKGEEV
jgi:transcriptional regulator with GAF, ATPase, and Fis domain